MTKHKCCVCFVDGDNYTYLYTTEYWVCDDCTLKWIKAYGVLRRKKYHDLYGWKKWFPIFEEWVRKHQREKVVFT